jgi:uncharacterized protein YggE
LTAGIFAFKSFHRAIPAPQVILSFTFFYQLRLKRITVVAVMREAHMKSAVILLVVLVFAGLALGQDRPTITAQPNTVFVGADGKFEANPDTALVQFNISAQQDNSRAAYDQASKSAEQVREILRNNGIEPAAAHLGYFSIEPVYDYKQAKRKLVAYRVNESVSLKLKDFTKIAPIVQQLSDADISDSQSINYTLDDIDAAKSKAIEDAFRRARASAGALAQASGRALGELSYASVDTFDNIRPMPMPMARMSAMAAAPAPTEEFSPQTISVTAHVNAMFVLGR